MNEDINKCLFVSAFLSIYDIKAVNSLGFRFWNETLNYVGDRLGGYKSTYIKNLRDEFDAITGNHRVGWINRPTRKIIKEVYQKVKGIKYEDYLLDVKTLLMGNDIFIDSGSSEHEYLDDIEQIYVEGKTKVVKINIFERNKKARKVCLDFYGCQCCICGFDAEKKYGVEFKGNIQVHHRIPISQIRDNYVVDPIQDLIPVCPNCHMILHSKGKNDFYTVEEIKNKLKES